MVSALNLNSRRATHGLQFPIFSANAPNSDIERNTDWADSYIYVSPPLNIADLYVKSIY
jgi:hypothetical protein